MKKSLIAVLFLSTACFAQEPATNIILYTDVEWSTNGTDWHLNTAQPNQGINYFIGPGNHFLPATNAPYFFNSELTTNGPLFEGFKVIDTRLLVGNSMGTVTNVLQPTMEYVVKPTSNDLGCNVFYRPWLSITNYTPANTNTGILTDTNLPPIP